MADELSRLQECLDQLLTQMYASLHYIDTNAPVMPIAGQPYNVGASSGLDDGNAAGQGDDDADDGETAEPDRTDQLNAMAPVIQEFSTDILVKYRQINGLLDRLPGVGVSEQSQRETIAKLNDQLRQAEQDRRDALAEWDDLMGRVNSVANLGRQQS